MTNATDYTDARELVEMYKQQLCPKCGVERWFKHIDRDHWTTDQWNCQECGTTFEQTLEYPCPECGTRMMYEGQAFTCMACSDDTGFVDVEIDRDGLIESMTEEYDTAGYAYGRFEQCPVCGERSILNGPDGERSCDKCDKFYAGRFTNQWFCYAIWKKDPEKIRVNEP